MFRNFASYFELLSYALTVGGIIAGTLIPAYLALYLIPNLNVPLKYIGALGVGLTFWFFYDTMGDASSLDANAAAYPFSAFGGLFHFEVIIAFVLGIIALAIFDHIAVSKPVSVSTQSASPGSSPSTKYLIFIPIAVAAVMGIHGLGEGWDFASVAVGVGTTDIVSAFGGWNPLVSYPIHKSMEAAIIACVYTIYVKRGGFAASWHLPVLGLLFGLTSVIGAATGFFYPSLDTTFFYAFGVTSAFYAMIRLAGPLVSGQEGPSRIIPTYLGPKTFLWVTVGFFLLYSAALLH
jgi:hypothetical protein